jgi:hypothetical protein
MTTFYRGSSVRVTDEMIEVQSRSALHVFRLNDLTDIYAMTGRKARATMPNAVAVRVCAAGLVAAVAVVVTTGAAGFDPILIPLGALVVGASIASVVAICREARPRIYELWAVHRGGPVCLFRTANERLFGEVRRAVVRALERHAGDR